MKINADLQLIESEASASLQSKKALASPGRDGWELVSSTAMFNTWMTKVVYVLFLKRPVT